MKRKDYFKRTRKHKKLVAFQAKKSIKSYSKMGGGVFSSLFQGENPEEDSHIFAGLIFLSKKYKDVVYQASYSGIFYEMEQIIEDQCYNDGEFKRLFEQEDFDIENICAMTPSVVYFYNKKLRMIQELNHLTVQTGFFRIGDFNDGKGIKIISKEPGEKNENIIIEIDNFLNQGEKFTSQEYKVPKYVIEEFKKEYMKKNKEMHDHISRIKF